MLLGDTSFVSLVQVKKPGLEMSTVQSELDLSYGQRYQGVAIPEAYERLILDTYASQPLCISLVLTCLVLALHILTDNIVC